MYSQTWKKYLPVIRILLKRSAISEQVINVDRLDFERVARGRKPLCSFSVQLIKGRVSPLNSSIPAKELVELLRDDEVTGELVRQHHYSISLNNKFELQIKNATPVAETLPFVQAGDIEPVIESV